MNSLLLYIMVICTIIEFTLLFLTLQAKICGAFYTQIYLFLHYGKNQLGVRIILRGVLYSKFYGNNFSGPHTWSSHLGPRSLPTEIYMTWDLCVGKLHLTPLKNGSRGRWRWPDHLNVLALQILPLQYCCFCR